MEVAFYNLALEVIVSLSPHFVGHKKVISPQIEGGGLKNYHFVMAGVSR